MFGNDYPWVAFSRYTEIVACESKVLRDQVRRNNLKAVKMSVSFFDESRVHFIFKKAPFPDQRVPGTTILAGQNEIASLKLSTSSGQGLVLKMSVLKG